MEAVDDPQGEPVTPRFDDEGTGMLQESVLVREPSAHNISQLGLCVMNKMGPRKEFPPENRFPFGFKFQRFLQLVDLGCQVLHVSA